MQKSALIIVALGVVAVAGGVLGSRMPQAAKAPDSAPATAATFVVKDARVFDGETVNERSSVLVRNGRIAAVGPDVEAPSGATVIDGTGRTLMPGLIDAHTHTFGDALERALVYGVTTEFDMFTDHAQAAQWRREQAAAGGAAARADIFSAGTLVTAPKGHGTQFGMPIPTITSEDQAQAFVDARLAEGSDYIKVVYEEGSAYGLTMPALSEGVLRAVIGAAKARGKLAVVHVGSAAAAQTAIDAGASGLVHIFADVPPPPAFAANVRRTNAFVTPTLSVLESVAGHAGGARVGEHPALAPFVTGAERDALKASFPQRPGNKVTLQHAVATVRALHAAGVVILAGSDAPNTGTIHGGTIHRELELLVTAGLAPIEALKAATSRPASAFRLADRGRIASGMRADLVLVEGDPSADITATRAIVDVWKGGVRLQRRPAPTAAQTAEVISSGAISDFDDGQTTSAFGSGWQISTDTMLGGRSEAAMKVIKPGAGGSAAALEITGAIAGGAAYPWAGAMFFPASQPMQPADLSTFKEIVFQARGDGREYQVMLFATRLGNIPATQSFSAGPEWREVVIPLASFGVDGSDLRGILFSADARAGAFRVAIDAVRLR